MTRKIVVVDLDGTLCNSAHRDHLAIAKQWDEFHSKLGEDNPWPDVKQMIELLDIDLFNFTVVGLTGRNERYRNATNKWLDLHGIRLDDLIMRPDNDYTPDHELKPAMLGAVYPPDRIWFILEDRDKVVEAWRNLGYRCWQTNPGGY